MTPEIPKGWEKCDILEARNIAFQGNVLELENRVIALADDIKHTLETTFQSVGITPVRKVKVEPIEFTVRPIMDSGHIYGTKVMWAGVEFNSAPEEWIGKTFREVVE